MTKDEMKDKISMALKDPILQQGFEVICKENSELKEQIDKNLVKNLIHEGKNLLEICETVNLNTADLGLFLKINPDLRTEYQSFNESKVLKANGGLKICKPRAVL